MTDRLQVSIPDWAVTVFDYRIPDNWFAGVSRRNYYKQPSVQALPGLWAYQQPNKKEQCSMFLAVLNCITVIKAHIGTVIMH
jgi:hypothetical protein